MSTPDEREYLDAITEILTIFDDDPQMTEDIMAAAAAGQDTAESAALVKIREIGRRVMEGRGTAAGTAEYHAREAARLLEHGEHDEHEPDLTNRDVARAQVHATLAQALNAAELRPMMARLADWVASDGAGEPAP